MVDIVIPIYKKDPTLDDTTAINQAFKLLKGYDITFVHPKSLDITNYKKFGEATFKAFNDTYFESIYGYNQLMLNVEFYETFSKRDAKSNGDHLKKILKENHRKYYDINNLKLNDYGSMIKL